MKKVIVVGADWCGACKALKTQLESKGVEFEYMDGDKNIEFCIKHSIKSLPTTLIMEGDETLKVVIGNKIKEILNGF